MHNRFIAKGVGVCKSEFGWTDRNHPENLAYNANFYVELCEKFGFSCMVWDNGSSFGIINRNTLSVDYPDILNQ